MNRFRLTAVLVVLLVCACVVPVYAADVCIVRAKHAHNTIKEIDATLADAAVLEGVDLSGLSDEMRAPLELVLAKKARILTGASGLLGKVAQVQDGSKDAVCFTYQVSCGAIAACRTAADTLAGVVQMTVTQEGLLENGCAARLKAQGPGSGIVAIVRCN